MFLIKPQHPTPIPCATYPPQSPPQRESYRKKRVKIMMGQVVPALKEAEWKTWAGVNLSGMDCAADGVWAKQVNCDNKVYQSTEFGVCMRVESGVLKRKRLTKKHFWRQISEILRRAFGNAHTQCICMCVLIMDRRIVQFGCDSLMSFPCSWVSHQPLFWWPMSKMTGCHVLHRPTTYGQLHG